MALITLINKISEALANDDFVIGVFLDFCKAFNTDDHSFLLKNLHSYIHPSPKVMADFFQTQKLT